MTYDKKLYVCLITLFTSFIPVIAISLYSVRELIDDQTEMLEKIGEEALLIERLQFFNAVKARQVPAFLLSGDHRFINRFEESNLLFEQTLAKVVKIAPEVDRVVLADMSEKSRKAYAMFPAASKMLSEGIRPEIVDKYFRENVRTITGSVDAEGKTLSVSISARQTAARKSFRTVVRALEIALGVSALLTLLAAIWVSKLVLRIVQQKNLIDVKNQQLSNGRKEAVEVVAHDIKSPLATIQMMLEILHEEFRDMALPENLQSGLELIERAATTISNLVTQILDHAKIEAGDLQIESETCSLSRMLDELVTRFSPIARAKSVTLVKDISAQEIVASFDPVRMDQAVSNLLANAIKFTPEYGTVKLSCHRRDGKVLISISDSGPGLSADQIPHVFDRYWQVRESSKRGNGLGLSIVKSIVTAHHGSVSVKSEPACGSDFSIQLPI